MKTCLSVTLLALAIPAVASAHASVQPRHSKPGVEASAEFLCTARNPAEGEQIAWKAVQKFAGGSERVWTPVTRLGTSTQEGGSPGAAVEVWLKAYDAAFNAKDLDKLATFYHPEVTVYEGGGINTGWADYRDRHLGPELKMFENLQFSHSEVKVNPLADGNAAYVTANYALKAKSGERVIDSGGLATYVLVKAADGAWKIRHSHTSSRPRRPAGGGN